MFLYSTVSTLKPEWEKEMTTTGITRMHGTTVSQQSRKSNTTHAQQAPRLVLQRSCARGTTGAPRETRTTIHSGASSGSPPQCSAAALEACHHRRATTHTDGGDGGDNFSELQLVQDGGFARRCTTTSSVSNDRREQHRKRIRQHNKGHSSRQPARLQRI